MSKMQNNPPHSQPNMDSSVYICPSFSNCFSSQIALFVLCKTLSQSPNRAVQEDCYWGLKNCGNCHWSCEPLIMQWGTRQSQSIIRPTNHKSVMPANRRSCLLPHWQVLLPRCDGRVVKVPDSGLRVTCNSATRGSNTSAATGHLRCHSEQAA